MQSFHFLQLAAMINLLHDSKTFLLLPDIEDLQLPYLKLQTDADTHILEHKHSSVTFTPIFCMC